MRTKLTVCLLVLLAAGAGCRSDAGAETPTHEPAAGAEPQAAKEVTLRIRKLGGADGKQIMNEMTVTTPLDDEFMVTEQVGRTQLELRGKVEALEGGAYVVAYDYSETSPAGRQQLTSRIQMQPNTEVELGGVTGSQATERIVLRLSRP